MASTGGEWRPGDSILDTYDVRSLLGEGGMGRVYRVHHRQWNVDLAMKTPLPSVLVSGVEPFIREAETWVRLELHPNVVTCYYVRPVDGVPCVFIDYVDGGSLAGWIADGRLYAGGESVALARVLDVAIQFAWGLDHAHAHGLIHQDVKPGNALFSTEGTLKVTDFGLARSLPLVPAGEVRRSPVSPGVTYMGRTEVYAAPEQTRRERLTRAADVWSWAVSVLEMFTGGITWRIGSAAPLVLQDYRDRDPGEDGLPRMPEDLADLLARCFSADPNARPQDLGELAQAVAAIHGKATGAPYGRPRPERVVSKADVLNNRALSLLDLGHDAEADAAWVGALAADPQHAEATYNWGARRWRRGDLTDEAFLKQLDVLRLADEHRWDIGYLLGLVHIERGDSGAAIELLQQAARAAPRDHLEVAEALRLAFSSRRAPEVPPVLAGGGGFVLSPDGGVALIAESSAYRVHAYDLASGTELSVLEGVAPSGTSKELSGDGRWVLMGGSDKTVHLWDVASGQRVRVFEGTVGRVTSVSLSADGSLALAGGTLPRPRLWESATGQCVGVLLGHTSQVLDARLSADGARALSASKDGTVRLWDTRTQACVMTLDAQAGAVNACAMSADGRWALSGGEDGVIRLWDLTDGRLVRALAGHSRAVLGIAYSPDARWALSFDLGGSRLWAVPDGRCLRTFGGAENVVSARLAVSGNAAHSSYWTERLARPPTWRLSRIRNVAELQRAESRARGLVAEARSAIEHDETASALALLRAARAMPGHQRWSEGVAAWNALSLRCVRTGLRGAWRSAVLGGHEEGVDSVDLSADGRRVVAGTFGGIVRLWDIPPATCVAFFNARTAPVKTWGTRPGLPVAVTADGRALACGEKTIWVFDLQAQSLLGGFEGHRDFVDFVSWIADGRWLLSASRDKTLRLWDSRTGRTVRIFEGHTGTVNHAALSDDGRLVVSGSDDKTVRLWDVATGQCLRMLGEHGFRVTSVCFSPDRRRALSASWDGTLRLWNLASGECVATMGRPADFKDQTREDVGAHIEAWGLESACFSPEGRWVFATGQSGMLRVWDTTTGACVRELPGHTGPAACVSLTADGHTAVSGGFDGNVVVWSLDWELEAREPLDWDEGARPHLERFLAMSVPRELDLPGDRDPTDEEVRRALTGRGRPVWDDEGFQNLQAQLQKAGYGWLRAEGVRRELTAMASTQSPEPGLLYCDLRGDDPWPRSVMRLLWERYPEVQEAFRREGLFVIEFGREQWLFEDDGSVSLAEAESGAREAYLACPARGTGTLLFIAHVSKEAFRALAARGLALPEGVFLGACGYIEGGVRFQGADGTFIESDDWDAARDYALRIADRHGRGLRYTPAAEAALSLAAAEAEALGSPRVEVEHAFIGLCRLAALPAEGPESSTFARAMGRGRFDVRRAARDYALRIADRHGRGLRYTPAAEAALSLAAEEAEALGSPRVEVEHAFIGLCRLAALPAEGPESSTFARAMARVKFDAQRAADRMRELCREDSPTRTHAFAAVVEGEVAERVAKLAALWWVVLDTPSPHIDLVLREMGQTRTDLAFAWTPDRPDDSPPDPPRKQ